MRPFTVESAMKCLNMSSRDEAVLSVEVHIECSSVEVHLSVLFPSTKPTPPFSAASAVAPRQEGLGAQGLGVVPL